MKRKDIVYDAEFEEYLVEDTSLRGTLSYNDTDIRVVYRADHRVWVNAADACAVLGYTNATNVVRRVSSINKTKLGRSWYVTSLGWQEVYRRARGRQSENLASFLTWLNEETMRAKESDAGNAINGEIVQDTHAPAISFNDLPEKKSFNTPQDTPGELVEYDFNAQQVRTVRDNDGKVWWVLRDVCDAIGRVDLTSTIKALSEGEHTKRVIDTPGGPQDMVVVNEAGIYRLTFSSKKSAADEFREWVVTSVLPEIRRTGAFIPKEMREQGLAVPQGEGALATLDSGEVVALMRREMSQMRTYIETTLEPTYQQMRMLEGRAQRVEEKLSGTEDLLEEARKERDRAVDEMRVSQKGHQEYMHTLLDQIRALQEEKEVLKASRGRWEKRARKWGRKLHTRDPEARHADDDLALLTEGMLRD